MPVSPPKNVKESAVGDMGWAGTVAIWVDRKGPSKEVILG